MASLEDLGFQSLCKGSRDSTGAVTASSREPWLVLLGSVLTLGLGTAYSLVAERSRLRDELAKMLPADRGPVLDGLSHLSNQGLRAYVNAFEQGGDLEIAKDAGATLENYPELGALYAEVRKSWEAKAGLPGAAATTGALLRGVQDERDARKVLEGLLYLRGYKPWRSDDLKAAKEVRKAFLNYSPTTVAALLAASKVERFKTAQWAPLAEQIEKTISKIKKDDDRRRVAEAVLVTQGFGYGAEGFCKGPLAPQYPKATRYDQAEIALGKSPKQVFYPVPLSAAQEYLEQGLSAGMMRRAYLVKTLERELDAFWKNDRELSSGSERGKDIAHVLESLRRDGGSIDPQRTAWLLSVAGDPERLSALTLERAFPGPDGQEVKARYLDKLYEVMDRDIPGPSASVHTVLENAAKRESQFAMDRATRKAEILPKPEWWPPQHEIPGVKLLRTNRAIAREGVEQEHCVGNYIGRAKSGDTFIASVSRPEIDSRTTLEVTKFGNIAQHRGFKNREETDHELVVGDEVQAAIQAMHSALREIKQSDQPDGMKELAISELSAQGARNFVMPWKRDEARPRDSHVRARDEEEIKTLARQIAASGLTREQKIEEIKLLRLSARSPGRYILPWMRGNTPKDAHVRARDTRNFALGMGFTPEEADVYEDEPPSEEEQ